MTVTSLMYHCKYINKCIRNNMCGGKRYETTWVAKRTTSINSFCFCESLLLGRNCFQWQFKWISPISQYLDDVRLETTIFGLSGSSPKPRRSNRIRINRGLLYVKICACQSMNAALISAQQVNMWLQLEEAYRDDATHSSLVMLMSPFLFAIPDYLPSKWAEWSKTLEFFDVPGQGWYAPTCL